MSALENEMSWITAPGSVAWSVQVLPLECGRTCGFVEGAIYGRSAESSVVKPWTGIFAETWWTLSPVTLEPCAAAARETHTASREMKIELRRSFIEGDLLGEGYAGGAQLMLDARAQPKSSTGS